MSPISKERAQIALADALELISKETWPDEVKADVYRMIAQFAFLQLSNVHAGFIDSVMESQRFLSEMVTKNMERFAEKTVDERREMFKIVKDEDLN